MRIPDSPAGQAQLTNGPASLAWLFLSTAILMTGCGHTVLKVTRAQAPMKNATTSFDKCESGTREERDACALPGIPFYQVGYRCVHTTVWIQPIYTVSVAVTNSDGKSTNWPAKTFTLKQYRSAELQDFLISLGMDSDSEAQVKNLEDRWGKLGTSDNPYYVDEDSISKSDSVYIYSNSVIPERYVETRSILFLNTVKPAAGSAEATANLNSDGTLGTASSKEESKTLATVAGLIPVSQIVQSLPLVAMKGAPQTVYKFKVSTKTDFYKHTHSSPTKSEDVPPCQPPVIDDVVSGGPANVLVEHIGDIPNPPAPGDASKSDATKNPKQ